MRYLLPALLCLALCGICRADPGLGVSVVVAREDFGGMGYLFRDASPVDGQPRIMGERTGNIVEFIGPPDDVTQATALVSLDRKNMIDGAACLMLLVKVAAQDWPSARKWVFANLQRSKRAEVTAKHEGRELSLRAHRELGILTLTVRALPGPTKENP